jgi:hypothetical protein
VDRREHLAVLPLADPAAAPLLAPLRASERQESWRLVRRDGSLVGYAGMRGRIPDAAYRVVARYRGLFGRLVPDGPAPRRFP